MKLESQDASHSQGAPTPEPAESPAQIPATPAAPVDPVVPGTDDVTDDIVQSAVGAARADAVAIAELCQLAGQAQRTATFLAEGASESQVRKALLAARAESPEITSVVHPDAANKVASPEHNPLMKAVKKLTGKE